MLDPVENGLSDYGGMDEDEAFPPLPPPHSPGQGGQDEGDPFANEEEDGNVSKLAEVPAAKRKGVRRPQPKLDSQRLISERGLPALRTLFDKVHFKGKGHEASDLRLLMQKMENWAHRLYPKLQFDDFIDKVEKLGNKKEVQTCLKRIRLDMPLTDEDFIGGEEATAEQQVFGDPDPFSGMSFPDELQGPVHSTPAPAAPPAPSPAAPTLTEEQRRRMELNRQLALERKLARQQQQQQQQQQPKDPSDTHTVNEPTSVSSGNILDSSDAQVEELDLDLELVHSSTQQPGQLPNTDSEAAAEPRQLEEATEEAKLDTDQQHSNTD